MQWTVERPRTSLALVALLCAAFVPGIPHLRAQTSSSSLMVKGDPDRLYYEEVKEEFGDDIVLSIVLKSEDVFQPDILHAVEAFTAHAEDLEGVTRVVSLATVNTVRGREGYLEADQLMPSVPNSSEGLLRLRRRTLENELLLGDVISTDGRTTAVHLFLDAPTEDHEFNRRIVKALRALIRGQQDAMTSPSVEMYLTGDPLLKVNMLNDVAADQATLSPASFVILAVVMMLFFRSPLAVAAPCATGALSAIVVLGFMGYMGFPINPVSAIIPILLVVIGATEDIHLLAEYAVELREGRNKPDAVLNMAFKGIVPICLTSFTTVLGFVIMGLNELPMLKQFGITTSVGLAANFVITILLIPAALMLFPAPPSFLRERRPVGIAKRIRRLEQAVGKMPVRHPRAIGIAALALAGLAMVGCRMVEPNTDFLGFFHRTSETRRTFEDISANLTGAYGFYVVVDTGQPGGVMDPDVLQQIATLSEHLNERFDKVLGYADFIRKIHREMNGGDPSRFTVPDSSSLVAQYTLMLDQDVMERFVSFDFSRACILVRTSDASSRVLKEAKSDLHDFTEGHLSPDLTVRMTGEVVLVGKASDTISRASVSNLSGLLIAILCVMAITFRSLWAGFLAMVPNILPILCNFGLMGFLGFALSPGTFPVAVIALGLCVDDTIHFLVRFQRSRSAGMTYEAAVEATVAHEFRPVTSTSVALILGLGVLVFSKFGSTMQFGVLASASLAVALVCDLFLTPVLLRWLRR